MRGCGHATSSFDVCGRETREKVQATGNDIYSETFRCSENRACTYCTAMTCLTTSGKRQDYGHDCGRMPVNRMGDITITGIFFPPLSLRTRIRGTKLNVGNANREQYEAPQEGKE